MNAFGFDVDGLDPAIFIRPRGIVRFGDAPLRIELVTTIAGVEFDACRGQAASATLDGIDVPTISLADLRLNKTASGRPKDLVDLEHLPEA